MNLCKLTPPEKTCCFTGHRSIPSYDIETLIPRLDETIDTLRARGIDTFRCGGALGFDTIAALRILRRKKSADGSIRLVLVLPCHDQDRLWGAADRRIYRRIMESADEVVYSAVEYSRENMLLRDRVLVDGCGICVAYLNTSAGGTAYTAKYALRSGLEVINLGSYQI